MNRKKILLLSDDIRLMSGIATQSKEFVLSVAHKYQLVQLGAAISHPDKGKIFDISAEVNKELVINNANVKIYPCDGYGNPDILRELIMREQPDAIMHFTDPRFWGWLYSMRSEIPDIPLIYWNIWDCSGYIGTDVIADPLWNEPFYRSCDLLLAISKQTYGINKRMLPDYEPWQIRYLPHAINTKYNYPINDSSPDYNEYPEYRKNLLGDKYDFVVFMNNRNIRRKNISDIVCGYKLFCDTLSPEKAKRCLLYLHTQAIDNNGTDLIAAVNAVCKDYNVMISEKPVSNKELRYLYNIADVTINICSNEGFGLATAESLMNGTPIIVNTTGGLQDQVGFRKKGKYLTADDYIKIVSLHNLEQDKFSETGKWDEHGAWAYPIWPKSRSLKGSPSTPFIFDDTARFEDLVLPLTYFYSLPRERRKLLGSMGREYLLNPEIMMNEKDLGKNFIDAFETLFSNWTPRKKFNLIPVRYKNKFENLKIVDATIKKPVPVKTELKLPKLKKIS